MYDNTPNMNFSLKKTPKHLEVTENSSTFAFAKQK